jgi:1,4-dihydroxy-2-naphthoate polyprenyltransferase
MKHWLHAARLRTLPAGVSPVVVGSALAVADGVFHWPSAVAALLVAVLLQVATNLANDYWDHVKGADTAERRGRARVVATGLLPGIAVRNAALVLFFLAGVVGLLLFLRAGWPVLAIGVFCLSGGWLYTAGPRPLGYNGFGDAMVFLFFGPVAVAGTYFVQALAVNPVAFLVSLPVGALATAILVVNNLRDMPTDRAAGKRTLAVLIGERATRMEYLLLLVIAYLVPVLLFVLLRAWWLLLPFLSLPLAVLLARRMARPRDGPALNLLLERTAMLLALYGALLASALLVSPVMAGGAL